LLLVLVKIGKEEAECGPAQPTRLEY